MGSLKSNDEKNSFQYIENEIFLQNPTVHSQAPTISAILKGKDLLLNTLEHDYHSLDNREFAGKKLLEAIPELGGKLTEEVLNGVYQTGKPSFGNEIPILIVKKEGGPEEKLYFNIIYQPTQNQSGETEGVSLLAYEVTKQVVARNASIDQLNKLVSIMESAPLISWILSVDGKSDYFNRNWYHYTGSSKDDIFHWQDFVHSDDLPKINNLLGESRDSNKMWEADYRLKNSEGFYRWYSGKSVPVKNNSGELIHWVGTASDIHDRKMYEEQLELLNRELLYKNQQLEKTNTDLDNFLYMASHDLKAPIANLEGLLMAYFEDFDTEGDSSFYQEMMFKSVERFKRTIKDLTEISKAQREIVTELEEIDFEDLLENIKSDIKELINRKDAVITTDFKIVSIFHVQRIVRSVLYNLLSNSIKYSSPERRPEIHISTYESDGLHIIKVEDNGLGLSPENINKMFMLFKRIHNQEEGTGVGLYMVKRMIENSGGKIEVESAIGKGSTFKIFLKKINEIN
ncbi:MAG: PAS domain-containing sensor histidine kinase [Opitutaceae bacterium]|nr:PAS domain-containing sensor histidine kinase [Cytophagales bacterium]